jgi:type VI protein secretion system component VasF
MKRRRINTRAEQDQEIERLGTELRDILQQRRRERWGRITWWIIIPFCVMTLIAALFVR